MTKIRELHRAAYEAYEAWVPLSVALTDGRVVTGYVADMTSSSDDPNGTGYIILAPADGGDHVWVFPDDFDHAVAVNHNPSCQNLGTDESAAHDLIERHTWTESS